MLRGILPLKTVHSKSWRRAAEPCKIKPGCSHSYYSDPAWLMTGEETCSIIQTFRWLECFDPFASQSNAVRQMVG